MKPEPELYKPAEACRVAEVAPYVLRYWETEFPALSEGKEKGAARLYSGRDVRIISRIRELLYDEGFTVAGAKKRLEAEISEGRFDDGLKAAPPPAAQSAQKTVRPETPPAAAPSLADVSLVPEYPPPPAPAPASASSSAPPSKPDAVQAGGGRASTGVEIADKKRVIRELKEIAKLLDKGRRTRS